MTTVPSSYLENEPAEEKVLEYVDNFRKQFCQLYPQRPEQLLSPKNEHGVQKFICTYIRKTKLRFKDLYDHDRCASFVANYITYQPLSNPERLPSVLKSPTATLERQGGNSFEFSLLLTSLLLGVGYDAYCVVGYADKETTLNDQTNVACPLVQETQQKCFKESNVTPLYLKTSYDARIVQRPVLTSTYEQSQKQAQTQQTTPATTSVPPTPDALVGRRVHSWVLVLPSKRDITSPIYIETSTGKLYPVTQSSPYCGIEAVFNQFNYWVNMQDSIGRDLQDLSFHLNDMTKWEFIFLDRSKEEGVQPTDVPPSWVTEITLEKEQFESQYPGCCKKVRYRDCQLVRTLKPLQVLTTSQELFTEFAREDGMIRRFTFYNQAQVPEVREFFANRLDFLSHRTTKPEDHLTHEYFAKGRHSELAEHIHVAGVRREMRFWPGNRLDGLVQREVFVRKKIIEFYDGREDRLTYQSATFDKEPREKDTRTKFSDGHQQLAVQKIVHKYSRNPAEPAAYRDPAKIVFHLEAKQVEVFYHKEQGAITSSARVYTREGKTLGFKADPFTAKPSAEELMEDYYRYSQIEKEAVTMLRDNEREAVNILEKRDEEEVAKEKLKFSAFDVHRNPNRKPFQIQRETENASAYAKADYISIFINSATDSGKRTIDDRLALHIYETCMSSYKERLRATERLIQSRLEKEGKILKKRMNMLNKRPDLERDEEEENQKAIAEASFRKKILEQRLHRHQTRVSQKTAEMQKKLQAHPWLAPFLKTH